MFAAIGGVLFAFIFALGMWYCGMVILDALWNSKGIRKARKEATEALIRAEKFLNEEGDEVSEQ